MSQLKWLSERAMLRDLAELAGVGSFESITAVTDKPLSISKPEDNVEYHLRFGTTEHNDEGCNEGPDFRLIEKMLDMVNSYDEENNPVCEAKSEAGTIIKISKLNPNVPEFVPKCTSVNINNECKTKDNKENNNNFGQNDDTGDSQNSATAIEETMENLKTKIINGIKSEPPVRSRILRNAAIMSLLKLHSEKSSQPTKIKLLTPEDFMGHNGVKFTNDEVSSEIKISDTKSTIQDVPDLSKNILDQTENVQSSPPTTLTKEENTDDRDTPSEDAMKLSIKKVDNWLSEPKTKEQKLKLHMGPITYKRKAPKIEQVDPQSKSSTRSSSPQVSKKCVQSELAEKLYKEYKERSLKNVVVPNDMWAPIKKEMCERDKKIKGNTEKSELQETQGNSQC